MTNDKRIGFALVLTALVAGILLIIQDNNSTNYVANDAQCDSIYHAMWILNDDIPARDALIAQAQAQSCPLED